LSHSQVFAKKLKLRSLLKRFATGKGHAFYSRAGENPRSNLLDRLMAVVVEYVAGWIPAAGTS